MLFSKIMLPIMFFLIGTIFASFCNMLMYRLAYDKPILKDSRSYCPKCNAQIKWYDNIPLISYLVLKGKCRNCHERISIRYFLVELFGGLSFVLIYFLYFRVLTHQNFDESLNIINFVNTLTYSFALLVLLISAYVDSKKKEIPFSMMISLLVLAVIRYVTLCVTSKSFVLDNMLSFVVPIALFLIIYLIGTVLLKKEPMGLGDIILFGLLGLLLGYIYLLSIILFSSLICSIVEIIKIKKTGERREIPFVPYICIGTVITVTITPFIVKGIEQIMGGF